MLALKQTQPVVVGFKQIFLSREVYNKVHLQAVEKSTATEVIPIEATGEQTPVDNEVSLMIEPEATQEISDLPETESTDVAMDVTAETAM
ncbi:hypothetical protein ACHAPQ_006582 [Fusarium lateritium]